MNPAFDKFLQHNHGRSSIQFHPAFSRVPLRMIQVGAKNLSLWHQHGNANYATIPSARMAPPIEQACVLVSSKQACSHPAHMRAQTRQAGLLLLTKRACTQPYKQHRRTGDDE